jgi:WD40 repeat protein
MPPTELPGGKRRALLVAHGTYADPRFRQLRAPTGDVEGFRAVLSDPSIGGFDVECVVDQTTPEVKRTIEAFFAAGGLHDLLVLYISGHGVMSEDRSLYFATSSTQFDLLDATAIEASFVDRQMQRPRTRTRSIVLILDCCHSGAFARGYAPKGRPSVGIEKRFKTALDRRVAAAGGYGHVVLTASNDLEYAFENMSLDEEYEPSEPGSVFTHFLVEGLRTGAADLDRDRLITVDELYEYAYVGTREISPHQTPTITKTTAGQLVIAHNPRPFPHPYAGTREMRRVSHEAAVRSVAFSSDGTRLGTASDDLSARVTDLKTSREVLRIIHPSRRWYSRKLFSVALHPDGERIATAGRDHTAQVRQMRDNHELLVIAHGAWVRAASFSPDGQLIATAGSDGTARVWSLSQGRMQLTITSEKPLNAAAFSHDSTRLATAGDDCSACVWDLTAADSQDSGGIEPLRCVTHDDAVWAVAFSPDGTSLATASSDRSARVWGLGEERKPLRLDHDAAVWSVAFSPDGTQIATAGADRLARVWDLADRREVLTVEHDDVIFQVTFSPEGGRLATASADQTARVWEL